MMTLMWLIAAMAAAVSYVYWNNQYSAFARTIDLIPGPRKIPLIGSILEFKENHGMYPLNCFILFHKKAPPPHLTQVVFDETHPEMTSRLACCLRMFDGRTN